MYCALDRAQDGHYRCCRHMLCARASQGLSACQRVAAPRRRRCVRRGTSMSSPPSVLCFVVVSVGFLSSSWFCLRFRCCVALSAPIRLQDERDGEACMYACKQTTKHISAVGPSSLAPLRCNTSAWQTKSGATRACRRHGGLARGRLASSAPSAAIGSWWRQWIPSRLGGGGGVWWCLGPRAEALVRSSGLCPSSMCVGDRGAVSWRAGEATGRVHQH